MNTLERIRLIVGLCRFEGFEFLVDEVPGGFQLHAAWLEPDIVGGKAALQKSRKWLLSPHMTKSEIVQTCFKLAMTAAEHRVRESFTYRGNRIFGPHFDVDALHTICSEKRFDVRKPAQ
jgi:hypothetical protein